MVPNILNMHDGETLELSGRGPLRPCGQGWNRWRGMTLDLLIVGLVLGAGLAMLGFLLREAGLSKRLSLPLGLADVGLALMGAAVTAWLLTAAAIAAELDDTTSLAVAGVGSLLTVIVGLALARRASDINRALLLQAGLPHPTIVSDSASPEEAPGTVNVADGGAHRVPTDDSSTPGGDASGTREKRDWESIWRETWGSGAAPKVQAGQDVARPELDGDDTARVTWSAGDIESAPGAEPEKAASGGDDDDALKRTLEEDDSEPVVRDITANWPS